MSADRDELRRLVEELPEEQVPAALGDVRRHLHPSERERPWPPAWFGAGKGSRADVAARSEELLAGGFGPRPLIVCDTGPLVAAALRDDDDHHACVELFTGLHLAGRILLIPAPVVAEVGYLIAREAGAAVEWAAFLRSIADGDFEAVDLTRADYARMADLVDQYADLPLGAANAAVVAVAERLGIAEIATLDRKDSSVVRPRHTPAFTLVP